VTDNKAKARRNHGQVMLAYYSDDNPGEFFYVDNQPKLNSVDEAEKYLRHGLEKEEWLDSTTWLVIKVCKRFKLRTQTVLQSVPSDEVGS